jgi:hypothetical protein
MGWRLLPIRASGPRQLRHAFLPFACPPPDLFYFVSIKLLVLRQCSRLRCTRPCSRSGRALVMLGALRDVEAIGCRLHALFSSSEHISLYPIREQRHPGNCLEDLHAA